MLRGRGRPARRYALTDAGHAAGPSAYDDLAVGALRFLAEAGGRAGRRGLRAGAGRRARGALPRPARGHRPRTAPPRSPRRSSADGYAATLSAHGTGIQLCQHHCPVQHAAAEFPQLCDAETAALGRLLGVHVQRLATIAHGDGVCTTFVPLSTAQTSTSTSSTQSRSTQSRSSQSRSTQSRSNTEERSPA